MGECPPLGMKKKFDPLNQPAICFLLLVPIYKRVWQAELTFIRKSVSYTHLTLPTILRV